MKSLPRLACLVTMLIITSGCATWTPGTGQTIEEAKYGYRMTQPSGWYREPYTRAGTVRLTKDGGALQEIFVGRFKLDKAFPETEKEATAHMLPQELAELYIAEVKRARGFGNLEVLSNEPTSLGGQPGFRVGLLWKNQDGLRYQHSAAGTVNEFGVYLMTYTAPVLHYYRRDLQDFDAALTTFQTFPIEKKKR